MAIADISDIGNTLSTLANPYGSPDNGVWNLQRGSFTIKTNGGPECIFFYVEVQTNNPIAQLANTIGGLLGIKSSTTPPDPNQKTAVDTISDGGGRRLAVYEYPYLDGQAIEDLGRKGEKFTFNIKFFGSNYQIKFNEFIQKIVQSNQQGILSHPVRGKITCRFQEYEFVHRHDEWNAVTIRATFIEDNTGAIQNTNLTPASQNSVLRNALQTVVSLKAGVSAAISAVSALTLLPHQIQNSMNLTLNSITDQISQFLGQLAATFSTDAQTQALFSNAATSTGNVATLSSGTTTQGNLPPVYQVGFSATDQANINNQLAAFILSNQVSPQQAVFNANQIRSSISSAITYVTSNTSNQGFNIAMLYRQMANQIQDVTQSCISSAEQNVVVYQVLQVMSLRMIAFLNGLTPDSQNDILALNPYIGSVNYVMPGTMVLVPAAA